MRLLTRSDFDGLACAILLKELGIMDEWTFVHPKDVQDGKIHVGGDDILANVPYAEGCGMWFDHHSSEQERLGFGFQFKGASENAPSAARVVWTYFGGEEKFGDKFNEMLHYVDKVDSGDLTADEVDNPTGWVLLGFLMDPRTGLGRYRSFRISNYALMEDLVDYCRTMPIHGILEIPDVRERVDLYLEQQEAFKEQLAENTTVHRNLAVIDLRDVEQILAGNRFTIYALYPKINVSMHVLWGLKKQNTVFTVGHSILNRTCKTDVGALMLEYGGGGHRQVGTCQVPNEDADKVMGEIIDRVTQNG